MVSKMDGLFQLNKVQVKTSSSARLSQLSTSNPRISTLYGRPLSGFKSEPTSERIDGRKSRRSQKRAAFSNP